MNETSKACPEELRLAFQSLLYHALLTIRHSCSDSQLVFLHADHVHNIPALLSRFTPELLKFYWEVERLCFLQNLPPDASAPDAFQQYWAVIEREYERLCSQSTKPDDNIRH